MVLFFSLTRLEGSLSDVVALLKHCAVQTANQIIRQFAAATAHNT